MYVAAVGADQVFNRYFFTVQFSDELQLIFPAAHKPPDAIVGYFIDIALCMMGQAEDGFIPAPDDEMTVKKHGLVICIYNLYGDCFKLAGTDHLFAGISASLYRCRRLAGK